jgi:hypothetical protein
MSELSKFCSVNGNSHALSITYCLLCNFGIETIDLSGSPPSRTTAVPVNTINQQSYQQLLPPAALIQRDIVNNQLKNIQNSCPNAGSNALSSRVLNVPHTTSQQFTFTIVLISESFYYPSQKDLKFGLPTISTRKHIGMIIFIISYDLYSFIF